MTETMQCEEKCVKLTWYLKQMKTMAMKLLRRIGGDWFWGRWRWSTLGLFSSGFSLPFLKWWSPCVLLLSVFSLPFSFCFSPLYSPLSGSWRGCWDEEDDELTMALALLVQLWWRMAVVGFWKNWRWWQFWSCVLFIILDFLSGFLPLLLFLWFYSLASSSKGQGTGNDGGWLVLVFFLLLFVCSSVIVSLPYASQFSFMSPSFSFYSPCSLSVPLCLVFLLSIVSSPLFQIDSSSGFYSQRTQAFLDNGRHASRWRGM